MSAEAGHRYPLTSTNITLTHLRSNRIVSNSQAQILPPATFPTIQIQSGEDKKCAPNFDGDISCKMAICKTGKEMGEKHEDKS
jgi:hypothetical protein